MQIIIYGSLYGSTKRYAEHLSEITGIEAVSFKDARDIAKYDRIIYMGALFAGSVLGLRKTASKMSVGQKLTIITVGMVDPAFHILPSTHTSGLSAHSSSYWLAFYWFRKSPFHVQAKKESKHRHF